MEGRNTSFRLSEFGVKQLGTKTMISSEMATVAHSRSVHPSLFETSKQTLYSPALSFGN